jgi:hypothetical protein
VKTLLPVFFCALLLAGCATSTVESRKKERPQAYAALSPEEKQLVDSGQIKSGMSQDAVFLAWGPPAQVLESEDGGGRATTWLFHGTTMLETRYWVYREVTTGNGTFLERHQDRDYDPQDYVRAEIIFANGKVARWRTFPKPLN